MDKAIFLLKSGLTEFLVLEEKELKKSERILKEKGSSEYLRVNKKIFSKIKKLLESLEEFEKIYSSSLLLKESLKYKEDFLENKLVIALLGEFSSGKSSFLNYILDIPDEEKLPTGLAATTKKISYLLYPKKGMEDKVEVFLDENLENNFSFLISYQDYKKLNDPYLDILLYFEKLMKNLDVKFKIYKFVPKPHLVVMDIPGINAEDSQNEVLFQKNLGQIAYYADVVFWFFDMSKRSIGNSYLEFIKDFNLRNNRYFRKRTNFAVFTNISKIYDDFDELKNHFKNQLNDLKQEIGFKISSYLYFDVPENVEDEEELEKELKRIKSFIKRKLVQTRKLDKVAPVRDFKIECGELKKQLKDVKWLLKKVSNFIVEELENFHSHYLKFFRRKLLPNFPDNFSSFIFNWQKELLQLYEKKVSRNKFEAVLFKDGIEKPVADIKTLLVGDILFEGKKSQTAKTIFARYIEENFNLPLLFKLFEWSGFLAFVEKAVENLEYEMKVYIKEIEKINKECEA